MSFLFGGIGLYNDCICFVIFCRRIDVMAESLWMRCKVVGFGYGSRR